MAGWNDTTECSGPRVQTVSPWIEDSGWTLSWPTDSPRVRVCCYPPDPISDRPLVVMRTELKNRSLRAEPRCRPFCGRNSEERTLSAISQPTSSRQTPSGRRNRQNRRQPRRLRNGNPVGDPNNAPRCGARTRSGAHCRAAAMPNGRCRMHGGPSTGPRTTEGLANSRQARLRHGRYSAARRQLRRQLRWISHFAKVLDIFDEMYRLLFDLGIALESDQPPSVVAAKCVQALPLYERYLKTLDAGSEIGIETSKRRLQRREQRLLAVLWAGSRDALSEDLPQPLAGSSLGTSTSIFRLLDDS